MNYKPLFLIISICLSISTLFAQKINDNKFRQLGQELPTPNVYRAASGAPGHEYWQQKADYKIAVVLDDTKQRLDGSETITYFNNSPDALEYLWIQLDQNMRSKDSDSHKISNSSISDKASLRLLKGLEPEFDGGFKIQSVKNTTGQSMNYTINKTMMRIDLDNPLASGANISFSIDWWYNINDRMKIGGRSGYEYFEADDNYLYTIAQFFPRMAVYNEVDGWQHKQFLGRGEFALNFGDYEVEITVPDDHLVASTGSLQNADDVLTEEQKERYAKAEKEFENPVIIATQEEAEKRESKKSKGSSTWVFHAENVRDFAFATSRKFIWDAMNVEQEDGTKVMAMSMYPKEGNPLWEQYSTKAVAHTLKWYSHYTFPYPYPVAWSIHAKRIGMEYPMICFNFGRPESDGTYTKRTKYRMIGVIIHEVGHNYFPMIVNSDERQWTWMDEGLNSFTQYLAEQQWERNYPSRRGPAHKIVDYMKGDKQFISPIMSNSESIWQFGNNAYGKPATALNILRETVMGRELFDHAFKTYSKRWMFKHPSPADFFRTMEDASAVDLDWFWRGWFYTTDNVDIAIKDVKWMKMDTKNPDQENLAKKEEREESTITIESIRNKEAIKKTQDEIDRSLVDFYTTFDPLDVNMLDREEYKKYVSKLSDEEKQILQSGKNYYELTFENVGGLVMPLIIEFKYKDGSSKIERIPAEIWKMSKDEITKVFVSDKEITEIVLDPYLETADTDRENNYYPPKQQISRFELFKQRNSQQENSMQRDIRSKNKQNKKSGTN